MALYDAERVVQSLLVRLQEKDSWGRRELTQLVGELMAEFPIDESTIERTLRQYGLKVSLEALGLDKRSDTTGAAGVGGNGHVSQPAHV